MFIVNKLDLQLTVNTSELYGYTFFFFFLLIDSTLTGMGTLGQSKPRYNANEEITRRIEASPYALSFISQELYNRRVE